METTFVLLEKSFIQLDAHNFCGCRISFVWDTVLEERKEHVSERNSTHVSIKINGTLKNYFLNMSNELQVVKLRLHLTNAFFSL